MALPLVVISLVEAWCFPVNYFNHRNWEALLIKSNLPHYGPFFSNIEVKSIEEGDLAHHTQDAVKRENSWKTDALGFRNASIVKTPDILIIGDSFMNGTSLSQEEIFSNQLVKSTKGKYSIYCMAPYTFEQWILLLETGVVGKPKMVIFSNVERTTPAYFQEISAQNTLKTKIKRIIAENNLAEIQDKYTRFYSLEWLCARMKGSHGNGYQSPVKKGFYFLNKEITSEQQDALRLEETVKALKSYDTYCKANNIGFLYLPMPNKESVYYELMPLKAQPNYIHKLCDKLKENQVDVINSLSVYNKSKVNGKLLYQLDDTHWNKDGVAIIVKSVTDNLNQYF